MRYYAAPMEGLTGYVFRNAHRACFPGVDAYFTPFIAPNMHHTLSTKEMNDLLPEHNAGTPVVPQILTNNAGDFLWAAQALADMGYGEVNLNLGCPSPTVVTKGKGAGMLGDPARLDAFLETVFAASPVKISLKTRIGLQDAGEFAGLLEIFNRYPASALIVHPRIQPDMYKKPVRPEAFRLAAEACAVPLVYNGDLFDVHAAHAVSVRFSGLHGLMFGRGLIANPGLVCACRGLETPGRDVLRKYHDMILEGYAGIMPGDTALLFRMRELWRYMAAMFPDRGAFDKKLKKISKITDYRALTENLFDNCEADLSAAFRP